MVRHRKAKTKTTWFSGTLVQLLIDIANHFQAQKEGLNWGDSLSKAHRLLFRQMKRDLKRGVIEVLDIESINREEVGGSEKNVAGDTCC